MSPDARTQEPGVQERLEKPPPERPAGTRSDYDALEGDVKADVGRFISELWNKHRPEACDEFLADDFVDHDPHPGEGEGPEGYKAWAEALLGAFPDLVVTIDDMLGEGSKCAMRLTWSGTHRGGYLGMAPTGRRLEGRQMEFVRVRNRRIVERWALLDRPWLTEQIDASGGGHASAGPATTPSEISSTEDARTP